MKTPVRMTLPGNTHERPVHELKYGIISRCFVYGVIVLPLFVNCYLWWALSRKTGEVIIMLAMISLGCILWVVVMSALGDIYFYEQYVEIRRLLPFIKGHVIYYDNMHVRINDPGGGVTLQHYQIPTKFWKSPYTWFKANCFEVINIPRLLHVPETEEFVKPKARSVEYYTWR